MDGTNLFLSSDGGFADAVQAFLMRSTGLAWFENLHWNEGRSCWQ